MAQSALPYYQTGSGGGSAAAGLGDVYMNADLSTPDCQPTEMEASSIWGLGLQPGSMLAPSDRGMIWGVKEGLIEHGYRGVGQDAGQASGTHWGRLIIALGIVGAGVWWLTREEEKKTSGPSRARAPSAPSGAGWYTLLYKESPRKGGAVTDRLSTFEGPFASKAEAQEVAEREGAVWYPKVKHYERLPAALAGW